MTDTTRAPSRPASAGAGQLFIDLGPIAVFVIAFNLLQRFPATKENAIYIATAIFMAATLAALGYAKWKTGRAPPVLYVTAALVAVFGGLTLLLRDRTFIQIKPTAAYLFYAAAIFGSFALRFNLWKMLFGHAFALPDRIWNVLALRWGAFFAFLALLNEYIRRTQSFDFWLNTRPVVVFPLILLFALLNTPLVMKHSQDSDAPAS